MVHQDEPYSVIYFSADQYGFANTMTAWKQTASYTTSELPDVEHWISTSGTTANIAVTGDLDSVNYLASSASNTIYDLWLYGDTLSGLESLNPLSLTYYNALATSIVSNSDHTNYTITFQDNSWQDGVKVTSDDFLYWMMSSLLNGGTSVNEGEYQSILGLGTSFTWLNGTTNYAFNGAFYSNLGAVPGGQSNITSAYHASGLNSFSFSFPTAYIFTDPILTGISPLPKHILEQYPISNWDTMFGALSDNSPKTVSWSANPSEGLAAGSYSQAYNYLVGNGPYMWHGYDATSQTGTLVQSPTFWNLTGLQNIGYDKITTYHVVHIVDKSAAISAFATGTVNALDTNYQFTSADKATISSDNGYTTFNAGPGAGSQEMGYNMGSPIFGTGTGTPNGQKDPSHAAAYARDVRQAISHLIPRDDIIQHLLLGAGAPGTTEMSNSFGFLYASDVTPYSYSPAAAISLLEAAGYGQASGGGTIPIGTIPTVNATCPTGSQPPTPSITVPNFVFGNTLTMSGTFLVLTAQGAGTNGFAITLQQSTDNGATWVPIALGSTNQGGAYSISYTPAVTGTVQYRVFFTGLPETFVNTNGLNAASDVEGYVPPANTNAGHAATNKTSTAYSQPTTLTIGTLADIAGSITSAISGSLAQTSYNVNKGLCGLASSTNTAVQTLGTNVQNSLNSLQSSAASKTDVQALTTQVNNLNNQLTTISYIAYAAIALAIILGLVAIFLSRRKPS